jgi:hypothetical protein
MLILSPDDLNTAEGLWRHDAEAQLAALEDYLDEADELFESDLTPHQQAARSALERNRDYLRAQLDGEMPAAAREPLQEELEEIDAMPPRSLTARVRKWRFNELTGRPALVADVMRELRCGGPADYGYLWRKRLLDRFDGIHQTQENKR